MNDLSLSVYVKKWIIVFIVNKLNFIYFTWFVYTFVNYKYNLLLKRDNVCLMALSTFVTLSRSDEGKEIRIVCSKMAQKPNAKCCGDVAAALWQCLDNIRERSCHNVGKRRRHNLHFRPCQNVVTTLWQHRCASWVVVKRGISKIQKMHFYLTFGFLGFKLVKKRTMNYFKGSEGFGFLSGSIE